MLEVANNLWIGDSGDEKFIARHRPPMDAVLVVANDLVPTNDWRDKLEYMHIGLLDGPGNPLAGYHAAVLGLVALLKRKEGAKVMVCDHDGGRALAVAIMALYLFGDCPSWDEAIGRLRANHSKVPDVNPAHRRAFFLMDWGFMLRVLKEEVGD